MLYHVFILPLSLYLLLAVKTMQQTNGNTFENKLHKCLSKLDSLKPELQRQWQYHEQLHRNPTGRFIFKSMLELSHNVYLVGLLRGRIFCRGDVIAAVMTSWAVSPRGGDVIGATFVRLPLPTPGGAVPSRSAHTAAGSSLLT